MKNTIIALAASAIALTSVNAQTIISSTGGLDVSQVGDLLSGVTTDLSSGVLEQDQHVAFNEGSTLLSSDLTTNTGTIAAGTLVASTYFHFDPVGEFGAQTNSGSATFTEEILGIIWSNGFNGPILLDPSNLVVGVSGVTYPAGAAVGTLENSSDISLTFSGNTVTWNNLASNADVTDNFRVITAIPEPSSALLLGLGAFGLLGRRKR